MPSHVLSGLIRSGLSRRQAETQVLRMEGKTQAEIGEELGLGTGTVKSHCHRIDAKVREATKLLELVEKEGER
ncbi:sigma factor-like helix-turn-helix DNA-binding protein [Haladaptatus pallidirubidus]|nr:sigma factor-like helix-turn-helix DNA-binding protein [Haladaptatus pallidirubidus]